MACYKCGPTKKLKMENQFIKRKEKHEIPQIDENSSVHEEQIKEEDPVVKFEFKLKIPEKKHSSDIYN